MSLAVPRAGEREREASLLVAGADDDFAVAIAMACAGRLPEGWLPARPPAPSGEQKDISDALLDGAIEPAAWSEFERAWYCAKAPFGDPLVYAWYLYALERRTEDDVTASEKADRDLQELDGMPARERVAYVRSLSGSQGDDVVVCVGLTGVDLDAIRAALVRDAPVVVVDERTDVEEIEGECSEVLIHLAEAPDDGGLRTDLKAHSSTLAQLDASSDPPRLWRLEHQVRRDWVDLGTQERRELLDLLRERFAILGPIDLRAAGVAVDNHSGLAMLDRCAAAHPEAWPYHDLVFVSVLWAWHLSAVGITEWNQANLGLAPTRLFLDARMKAYARALDQTAPTAAGLLDAARSVAVLREAVEKKFVRCFSIDGGSWERREHLLPRASLELDAIPVRLTSALSDLLGVPCSERGDGRSLWPRYVSELVDASCDLSQLLVAFAEFVVNDRTLPTDYVTITVSRGVKLDRPWELELSDVFSYTAIRRGFTPGDRQVRLSPVQVRNAIGQRMRYNVTCRARNYSDDLNERLKAQPFQFPDIGRGEDAHHGGHQAAGIRHVCRAPFPIEAGGREWRGLADIRLNRASHDDRDSFALTNLSTVVRYSLWLKAIAETMFSKGILLSQTYCQKLEDEPQGRVMSYGW
jgi:hypothetical protein